jgi:hypothetical protein
MDILVTLTIFIAGFITGALTFRNNTAKSEQIVKDTLKFAAKAEEEAKELAAKLKKKKTTKKK